MVRNQAIHLGQADALDTNALDDLGVAVSIENLPADCRRPAAKFGDDDAQGKTDGQKGRDNEGK